MLTLMAVTNIFLAAVAMTNSDAVTDQLPNAPDQPLTFVYGLPSQWQAAAAMVATTPNARLCLVDTLAEAQAAATKQHANLIDLSPKEAIL